ncbi:MAG: carboxypeptidase regulatory-like domain-containing protein [Eubacterium sp.]|nr:carboxypeptidase regulatory-like domain-containing protein [Eubacterium sp.]
MDTKAKSGSNALIGILVFVAAVLIMFSIPFVTYAQTGTLGQESPEIYCTYEQDGEAVDGNNLTAGTYDVNFVLSGMSNLSVLEITAAYDEAQVTIDPSSLSLISDDADAGLDSMGYILSGGNIVFGFVSTNEACSPLNEDELIIATVKMTFATDCDAADYITASQNPNLTFAQADYGDGYDDEYALVNTDDDYSGNLYLMSCDITPAMFNTFDVNGQIKIATDVTGTNTTVGIVGITVKVEKDGEIVATAVTDEKGYYTLPAIPEGEYTMTITGSSTVDRTVTLEVSADKAIDGALNVDSVGIAICDYNRDNLINTIDYSVFGAALSGAYNVYCDFNGDSNVNTLDYGVFGAFYGKNIVYEDLTL